MPTLGRQAARRSRPHFPPACPFRGRARRGKLGVFPPAPPVHSVAPDVDAPPLRDRQAQQVQLALSGHPQQQIGRPPHLASGGGNNGGVLDRVPSLHDAAGAAAAGPSQLNQAAAVELMHRIKAARSWQQLQSIVDGNLRSMNHLHVSAVVTHMAQLHASSSSSSSADNRTSGGKGTRGSSPDETRARAPSDELLLPHLNGSSALHVRQNGASHFRGGGGSVETAALRAFSHAASPAADDPRLHSAYAAGGRRQPWEHQPQAPALSPQLLPPPTHGDARSQLLQRLEHAVAVHVPNFEGRQLANTLWAVAKLGHRPSERWLELVLTRAENHMYTFEPQHLSNTLYALMLLSYMPPPAWLESFFAATRRQLHGFGPGELCHLCYAAGKLGLRPGRELLGGVLYHSLKHMQAYGVRELALLLYGIVHMGGSLPADWLRAYRKRVTWLVVESGALPVALLERMGGQVEQPELAELARAQLAEQRKQRPEVGQGQQQPQHDQLRTSRNRHNVQGQWQRHDQQHAGRGGSQCAAAETPTPSRARGAADGSAPAVAYLPTVLLGLAEVGYRPPPVFVTTILAAVGSGAGQLTKEGLTTVLLSLANMRYRPHPALFRRVWDTLMDSLDSLDTQQCTIAVWACATLGCEAPRRDVHAIIMNAAARLPEHSDSELVQLLDAVSALGFEPTTSWLELLESDLYNRLPRMQPQEVAKLLLPLAGLRHRPHRLWMTRWAGALQVGLPGLGVMHLSAAAFGAARLGFRPPSRLCSELLAATGAGMAAAVAAAAAPAAAAVAATPAAAAAPAALQQQQHGLQGQGLEPELGQRQRRARPAWARRLGDRTADGHLPQTLSRLLWSLAVLDIRPEETWLAGYMACLRLVAGKLSALERSQVVWALARLRHDPGPEWAKELARWRRQQQQRRRQGSGTDGQGRAQHATAASGATASAGAAPEVRPGDGGSNGASSSGDVVAHVRDSSGSAAAATGGASGSGQRRDRDDNGVTGLDDAPALTHRSGSSSGTNGDSSSDVDLNTLVLQGIREWAVRQLSDPATEATPKRRRAVVRGR
ncbi:hypothetical protein PLESTB_000039700 [Pleodorina starrii]|uniref:Uncharacterized protein n=1 Tax=Pleodorina starrii TaxID=330485 RepID=A0A9W6B8W5_9CHLO|nr:hypothetical protein PLESTM_001093300 [Pleodorina starrii]GLC47919.1 hypothetical protein PLESTB_000039700 [Pleodorina starrii]GLC70646.1 hypothetical protein PLESTF_001017700 [Pleodorina starrii]